jgi:hypothetical protein
MISRLRLKIAQRLQIARRFCQPLSVGTMANANNPLVLLSFRRAAAEARGVLSRATSPGSTGQRLNGFAGDISELNSSQYAKR